MANQQRAEFERKERRWKKRIKALEDAIRETLDYHEDCICRNRRDRFEKILGITADTGVKG